MVGNCWHLILVASGSDPAMEARAGGSYHWEPSQEAAFFPGRQASVVAFGKVVGHFGVVHPEVRGAWIKAKGRA